MTFHLVFPSAIGLVIALYNQIELVTATSERKMAQKRSDIFLFNKKCIDIRRLLPWKFDSIKIDNKTASQLVCIIEL